LNRIILKSAPNYFFYKHFCHKDEEDIFIIVLTEVVASLISAQKS